MTLGVACQLVREPQLLPGEGDSNCIGPPVATTCRNHSGREQMAIEGFAAALESIPRILAENAGLDPIDELLRITAAQSEKLRLAGFGCDHRSSQRYGRCSITEPLAVTRHAIAGATEAAISVLRIDDVLWAKQDAQEPDWQTDED